MMKIIPSSIIWIPNKQTNKNTHTHTHTHTHDLESIETHKNTQRETCICATICVSFKKISIHDDAMTKL